MSSHMWRRSVHNDNAHHIEHNRGWRGGSVGARCKGDRDPGRPRVVRRL